MFSKSGVILRDCHNLLLKFSAFWTFLSSLFLYPSPPCERYISFFGCLTFPHFHRRDRCVKESAIGVSVVFSMLCVALHLYRCKIITTITTTTATTKTPQIYYKRLSNTFILSSSPYHHSRSRQKLPALFNR